MNVNRKEKIIKSASNIQYSGVTRAQFKGGGHQGCTTFSRGACQYLYPAASNGDLFFQNSEWGAPGVHRPRLVGGGGGWARAPVPPPPP